MVLHSKDNVWDLLWFSAKELPDLMQKLQDNYIKANDQSRLTSYAAMITCGSLVSKLSKLPSIFYDLALLKSHRTTVK